MSTPRFYLKTAEKSTGLSLIYLQFKYNRSKLVYAFGETIRPADWDSKKQLPKNKERTNADGTHLLVDMLQNLARECNTAYHEFLADGFPTPEMIKTRLDQWMQKHHNRKKEKAARGSLYDLIDRFVAGEIKHKGKSKAANTLKTYQTAKGHLEAFEKATGYKVEFDSITLDFYYKFVAYLQGKPKNKLSTNAVGKVIQILKVFMSEAVDLGFTSNLAFRSKKFAVSREETDAVYLSESELMKLYNHDFQGNKRLEQVKDLFVFGSFVGLRFSDYNNVKPENIIDVDGQKFIRIKTKKTGTLVYVPCNPVVLDIFDRYKKNPNSLPKSLSDVKFNLYIKEACEAAGLAEKGRLVGEPDKELFNCVTSHTARRSFATNYYLDGFPTMDLMRITGHKTEKSFRQYIKVSKLDAAKRMAEHNRKKNWAVLVGGLNEKLRVAS